jgi:hypothetical protein
MTREAIMAWAPSAALGERTWAYLQRLQQTGYEVRCSVTRKGDLLIEVLALLSEDVDLCDTERPSEPKQAPLLPPE